MTRNIFFIAECKFYTMNMNPYNLKNKKQIVININMLPHKIYSP